jgi:hypothetical protein
MDRAAAKSTPFARLAGGVPYGFGWLDACSPLRAEFDGIKDVKRIQQSNGANCNPERSPRRQVDGSM